MIKKIIQLFFYNYTLTGITEGLYKNILFNDLNKFLKHKVKKGTILITEAIYSHAEVLPGLIKYVLDLGYKVDVLITNENFREKPLEMFRTDRRVKVFNIGISQYIQAIRDKITNEYDYVIFSSSRVYYEYNLYKERFVLDYVKNTIPDEKIILMEHHLDLIENENLQKYKFISLPEYCEKLGIRQVNTHYFGKFKKHNKNKITRFITAGGIEKDRKNHNLLIDAVRDLLSKNIVDFEVIVVGHGILAIEDEEVKKKIKCTGRLTYKDLYKYIQSSDYILALLDSKNPAHERYIKDGTSGTFQLCYGFLKPLIIENYFAEPHNLSKKDAIIYDGGNLEKAMEFAIKQNNKDYQKYVDCLKIIEDKLYKKSIKNLESYIGKNK